MDKVVMAPAPGARFVRFVGDSLRFTVSGPNGAAVPEQWRPVLRANLGRASGIRGEIIAARSGRPGAVGSWRNVPMRRENGLGVVDIALCETGFFQAKACLIDPAGREHWPDGPNVCVTVHPDRYRTNNTVYCAFVRMFGESRGLRRTEPNPLELQVRKLDQQGYTVIPPSGKFRDLLPRLDHIFGDLGCRILQLLPINPTPTTYARFGRFGSPYASQDLTAVDPALVEFDRCTTGIDQFQELTYAVHLRNGRLFLDVVINHTGWGSVLQENYPEWFLRGADGAFLSPGAWGNTWEDLVELDHRNPSPWDYLAEVFLTWCRRGVDGFRCDAGYKVPLPAWRYITARVHSEFPETVFLLEGLGGSWEATEQLLQEGGMQWAYSELFQNYSGTQVAQYLDYCLRQSAEVGLYVHYSETHDNNRLAQKGRAWSLLRNRLCALTSVNGAYAFTCGVEWLADEKIDVHSSRGLSWGQKENIVHELRQLTELLRDHPCFFDGAVLKRLSGPESVVYALSRQAADGAHRVLVLVNTDLDAPQSVILPECHWAELGDRARDLLGQKLPARESLAEGRVRLTLRPAAVHCVGSPAAELGDTYRQARARAAWACSALGQILPAEWIGGYSWQELAALAERGPERLVARAVAWRERLQSDASATGQELFEGDDTVFPRVVTWTITDLNRVLLVPPDHYLMVRHPQPFRACLRFAQSDGGEHLESVEVGGTAIVSFRPRAFGSSVDAVLELEFYDPALPRAEGWLRFLGAHPVIDKSGGPHRGDDGTRAGAPLVLLTNGRGAMSRMPVDFGAIKSKYDCVLGANLHAEVPVDRHVFIKRLRAWAWVDGFVTPLNGGTLSFFEAGPPATWCFKASAGDGQFVEFEFVADLLDLRNTAVIQFAIRPPLERPRREGRAVVLIIRPDIEDRNFHCETHRNGGAEHHFSVHAQPLKDRPGFQFTPEARRQLRVYTESGEYQHEGEWSVSIGHSVDETRGQVPHGDAYSPGWFGIPLEVGAPVKMVITAEIEMPDPVELREFASRRQSGHELKWLWGKLGEDDAFGRQLLSATHAFLVRRRDGKTVIAGYPWFLDWGRDSLICARGVLSAGLTDEVRQLLITYGRFEAQGTLPNSIFGEDASNRDTSDASLWYGVACAETAALLGESFYQTRVDKQGRTILDVLLSIATHYRRGTPNGIRVDPATGLVWSPSHFTWMDTNFPAGTPRTGYPVEVQALWIRLLRQLHQLNAPFSDESWQHLADRALESLQRYFWLEDRGYYADALSSEAGQSAAAGTVDDALRCNVIFLVSLGLIEGERARRTVEAVRQFLVVPGALRSLAPLPVSVPAPIYGTGGHLLNNPERPYWGRYEGDEDTRRKPAYHNGTGWTWPFPSFCEAVARAWEFQPPAVAAAKAYLSSVDRLLNEGCIGHVPELVDGDAPHQQRGCDAQAWGATEALRVWKLLNAAEVVPGEGGEA